MSPDDDAETEGSAFTATLTVEVFEHPFTSVPVTVYVVDAAGASITLTPLSDPGIQSYEAAPDPVSVTLLPIQTADEDDDAETFGNAFTVIATVPVFEHPGPVEPVTVYVVVAEGFTVTEVPLSDPGIQVYVVPPLPVSVVLLPLQIVDAEADAVIVGCAPTVMAIVDVAVQPFAPVPVTV